MSAGLSLFLVFVVPFVVRAFDTNGDNLPDDWEASYGITTGAYASTNLIGWWQTEPNSTNVVLDNTTNHLDGTLTDFSTNPFVTGLFNSALSFSTNGQVNFPTNAALNTTSNQFAFSAWFQATSGSSQESTIASWSDGATNAWSVGVASDGTANITFFSGTNTEIVTGTGSPIDLYDGNWHQVAATLTTSKVATVYVDGEGEATNTITGWAPVAVSSFSLGIPNTNVVNGPYLLDEVRLYNRALGAEEVMQLPVTYTDLNGTGLSVFDDYLKRLNPLAPSNIGADQQGLQLSPHIADGANPKNTVPLMTDFLAARAQLANALADMSNLHPQTQSLSQRTTQVAFASPGVTREKDDTALFDQQNASLIEARRQRAEALAAGSDSEPRSFPPPLVIPASATSQMRAFLILRDQLDRAQIQLWNQNLSLDAKTRNATLQRWYQDNSTRFNQLHQLANNLPSQN